MDVTQVARLVRRRGLLVLVALAAGLVAAVTLTNSATPIYESKLRMFVAASSSVPAAQAYETELAALTRASLYAELITSTRVLERARSLARLADDTPTPGVNAEVATGSVLINVTISGPNPVHAQRFGNALAEALPRELRSVIAEDSQTAYLRVLVADPATLPTNPSSPNRRLNYALGAFIGLLAGAGLAFASEQLDTTIDEAGEASLATGSPLLGVIPTGSEATGRDFAATTGERGPPAEAFRALRTAVRFMNVDSPLRSIMVTSPSPAEGKTLSASSLAASFAQSGERVVLVDADLRRSSVPEVFGTPSEPGLTSVIRDHSAVEGALFRINERLAVLPPGALPPNPAEILGSQAMADLLVHLTDTFDIVIFDTPPVLPVADAQVLATLCDGVILMVRHGKTRRENAAEAKRRLDVVGATVLGCVLNAAPASSDYSAEYRYVPPAAGGARKRRLGRLRGVGPSAPEQA